MPVALNATAENAWRQLQPKHAALQVFLQQDRQLKAISNRGPHTGDAGFAERVPVRRTQAKIFEFQQIGNPKMSLAFVETEIRLTVKPVSFRWSKKWPKHSLPSWLSRVPPSPSAVKRRLLLVLKATAPMTLYGSSVGAGRDGVIRRRTANRTAPTEGISGVIEDIGRAAVALAGRKQPYSKQPLLLRAVAGLGVRLAIWRRMRSSILSLPGLPAL